MNDGSKVQASCFTLALAVALGVAALGTGCIATPITSVSDALDSDEVDDPPSVPHALADEEDDDPEPDVGAGDAGGARAATATKPSHHVHAAVEPDAAD